MVVRKLVAFRWAAAVCALTLIVGCQPSDTELALQRDAAQKVTLAALEEDAVWVGTVTGYDGIWDDLLLLDYGGTYEARIDLAHIVQLDECDVEEEEEAQDAYATYLQKVVPIGSRVKVVRSQSTDGTYDTERGMVYKLMSDGTANPKNTSLNEQMAAAGVADPDPFVTQDLTERQEPLAQIIADQKTQMSDNDFRAWRKVVAAYQTAFKKKVGPLGKCMTLALIRKKKEQKESEASDRETRRWVRGPDGREGTGDDYTYGDGRDSSGGGGGGSLNVPGWLCPTRFC